MHQNKFKILDYNTLRAKIVKVIYVKVFYMKFNNTLIKTQNKKKVGIVNTSGLLWPHLISKVPKISVKCIAAASF